MQRKLIYFLYRLVQAVAFPIIVLYLVARGFRDKRHFRHIWERLGFLPHSFQGTAPAALWLHAVSVGEVVSSVRLLERLREAYPLRQLFVSTTTLTGRAIAEEKLRGLVDGVFYAPLDYCFAVRRVLRTLRPSVVIVVETEIWPNLYREVKRTGAGLLIVNGRISDRAMPRYSYFEWFFRHALAWPDAILAQSELAARRYEELGAPSERVSVAGNLKFDFDPGRVAPPDEVCRLLDRLQPAAVWIAASTMPPAHPADVDEDDVVLDAFQKLAADHPRLLLILVPRRPQRFDLAAEKLDRSGIPFLRRSRLGPDDRLPLPGALLLDSMGELSGLFAFADVVFMGGTLAERGGHNILEPAFFSRPVIGGPHMENFASIAEHFRAGNGFVEITSPAELAGAVDRLLRDSSLRVAVGRHARRLAEAEGGATQKAFEQIRRSCALALPTPLPHVAFFWLLWPLARLWEVGCRFKRSRALTRRRSLRAPVISVGGISVGGAGKTPCVLYLAERLSAAGMRPGILTRGYRRLHPERSTILEAGADVPVARTGDEAKLFLRAGTGAVGIGADRYATGMLLERRFHPGVILLDDGFQHWKLERQLDIVLIDALDPFAGGELLPLGRLREPLDALARADVFLINRVEPGQRFDGIEARLREFNAHAPILTSRVVPHCWIDAATNQEWRSAELSSSKVAAFCGIGNPVSFWLTLSGLGLHPTFRWAFGDHHHYRPHELHRLAAQAKGAGAEVFLTTEKDVMNLPPVAGELLAPLRLLWLKIAMQVEEEAVLLNLIQEKLRVPVAPGP